MITAVDTKFLQIQPESIDDREKQAKLLKLKKACQQFEAIFIQYILKSMRSASNKSDLLGKGLGSEIFTQIFDEGLSEKMAESSPMGLGNLLYESFTQSKSVKDNDKTSFVPGKYIDARPNIPVKKVVNESTANGIKLNKFDGIIKEAADTNNIDPNLVKAVILQESGGNPQAVSSKGAKGLMQLMDATAGMLGVTDPFDIRQNINGGVKYLSGLLRKFNGDTKKALAAYNAGPGAVIKYGGIPPYEETKKYVNNIMNTLEGYLKQINPDK